MTRKTKKTRKLRKVLLTVCCAALLVCVTIGATVAYLTASTQEIKNTFTVGNVDITLTEDAGKDNGHEFKMVPDQPIAKDPKVTVEKGSEACWLFVEITESENLDQFISYGVTNGWTKLAEVEGNIYYRAVGANATADQVFPIIGVDGDDEDVVVTETNVNETNKVKVLDTVTKEMMDEIEDGDASKPTLTFKAYAIQQAGFESNPTGAWNQIQDDLTPAAGTAEEGV